VGPCLASLERDEKRLTTSLELPILTEHIASRGFMVISKLALLLISCVVAIISRRTNLPYTVGLVVVGFFLAYGGISTETHLSYDLIFHLLLPPLIFEAAFHLKWRELRPILRPVTLLATAGVLLSSAVAAALMMLTSKLSLPACLIIGIVLSATDPVSVLALLKEAKLPSRIHKLLEAESLFNDGTASVLFALVPLALAGATSFAGCVSMSITEIFGGMIIGGLIGFAAMFIAGRTQDHLIEIAMTVIAAFSSFFIAQHLHTSGILSTLTAGMVIGNLDRFGAITEKGLHEAHSFWEFACFVANSFIFILIGLDLNLWEVSTAGWATICTIGSMLIARAVAVYGWCLPLRRTKDAVPGIVQHLLVWGGLRGALSIALVLALPADFPDRSIVIAAVFNAVVFSIIVQGVTVSPLIHRVKRSVAGS
jgi:CPA1 family monovalent cation:H+ antiporter